MHVCVLSVCAHICTSMCEREERERERGGGGRERLPGHWGQRARGQTRSLPVDVSISLRPGNHSSMRCSMLSTTEQRSLRERERERERLCFRNKLKAAYFVPTMLAGTTISKTLAMPSRDSTRKKAC